MPDPAKIAIRASTQDHLDIEDVLDGIVILKDGGSALVIRTTAINFDLLSEREQEAIIYAYAGLLNSLNFPIQIVIRSQRKDVSSYLRLLEEAEVKTAKQEIKIQIQKYRQFITDTVQKNRVLDKKFYIVIPMSALELGISSTLSQSWKKVKSLPYDKEYILKKAMINLYPKRDHILRLLAHLGLQGRQLNTQELIQLFFNIYNPETIGQTITETEQYQTPIVQISLKTTPGLPPVSLPPESTAPNQPIINNSDLVQTNPVTNPNPIPVEPIVEKTVNLNLGQTPGVINSNMPNPAVIQPTGEPTKPETTIYNQIDQLVKEATN